MQNILVRKVLCSLFWNLHSLSFFSPSPLWSANFKTKQAQNLSYQNMLHPCRGSYHKTDPIVNLMLKQYINLFCGIFVEFCVFGGQRARSRVQATGWTDFPTDERDARSFKWFGQLGATCNCQLSFLYFLKNRIILLQACDNSGLMSHYFGSTGLSKSVG